MLNATGCPELPKALGWVGMEEVRLGNFCLRSPEGSYIKRWVEI